MKTIVSITPISIQRDSRTFKQASSVARLGYNSIVVELEKSNEKIKKDILFKLKSIYTIDNSKYFLKKINTASRSIGIGGLPIKILLYIWYSFIVAFNSIPKASLYYLHGFAMFPVVWLKCKLHKAKFIYDAHDFYSDQLSDSQISHLRRCFINPINLFIEKMCINNAFKVITVSYSVANLLNKKFDCNPIVIHNYEDARLNKATHITLRQQLNLKNSDFILLVLGNAKADIAIKEIIEAMKYLPNNVHLVFLGRWYEPYYCFANDHNVQTRVHFINAVLPSEIVSFIDSSDISLVLYLPNNKNNLSSCPNKLFQSLSAGLPIIYSKLPEIEKIVKKYDVGIPISSLDPLSISESIKSIIFNYPKLHFLKNNALKTRSLLNWEQEEIILSNCLSEALKD